jgi:hypothetical protein
VLTRVFNLKVTLYITFSGDILFCGFSFFWWWVVLTAMVKKDGGNSPTIHPTNGSILQPPHTRRDGTVHDSRDGEIYQLTTKHRGMINHELLTANTRRLLNNNDVIREGINNRQDYHSGFGIGEMHRSPKRRRELDLGRGRGGDNTQNST